MPDEKTAQRVQTMRLDERMPGGRPCLMGFYAGGHVADWALRQTTSIGRMGSGSDIEIPSGVVSGRHGEAGAVGGHVYYRDLGSRNGTYLAGVRLDGTVELREGGALSFAPSGNPLARAFVLVYANLPEAGLTWSRVPFGSEVQEVVIGRASGDVALRDPYASERHASFFHSERGLFALDLMSTNGVWVEGERVDGAAPLRPMDTVRVGTTWVFVGEGELWVGSAGSVVATAPMEPATVPEPKTQPEPPAPEPQPAPEPPAPQRSRDVTPALADALVIDIVEKNVWDRVKKKTILRDVHLTIDPGELVLVLGGSGAGKSTFINAVMGNSKAQGSIHLGDRDLYAEYERIKHQIGYVPQQDLLRGNDTVRDTLLSAAQLRMPSGTRRAACIERAAWAAELLGLRRELDTMVGRLSGGQRKRLSIAVELVGDPTLFFLDEPDSGLDGVMARALMENLRSIADLGKMVLVITHGPDRAADLFSKVVVLGKVERDGAGHLLFCGSVDQAKDFFGVDTLEGVVRRINRTDEGGEGLADHYLEKWEGR